MTRIQIVVLVSTDPEDKEIKGGPFRQNIDMKSTPPEGHKWLSEYQAMTENYRYPLGYAAPMSTVDTLQRKAGTALSQNAAFLALEGPANAQVLAQVRALTRQVSALIRLEIGALDSTDGT